jgi:putative ABC transport system permease protein
MNAVIKDIQFALSSLRRKPGQSLMAAGILALVIGANTAIFRLGYGTLVQPIEAQELSQLVEVSAPPRIFDAPEVPIPVYQAWERQSQSFSSLAAYRELQLDLTGDGEPAKVTVHGVTPRLMETLGGQMALGRPFSGDEVQGKVEDVAILSHRLWVDRYAASPDVIGKSLSFSGKNHRIVGVISAGLRFPMNSDAWVPVNFGAREKESYKRQVLTVVGRLAPGVSLEAASAELAASHDGLKRQFPKLDQTAAVKVRPLVDAIVGPTRTALRAIMGGAYFVLFVGALNVALLLFARNVSRRKEVATRFALGARRGQIVRMLLVEAVVLSLAGALLGIGVGFWTTDIARSLLGTLEGLPGLQSTGTLVTTLVYAIAISVLVGIAFGVAPAVQLSFVDLNEVLKESGSGQAAVGRARWVRDGLLAGQVCLALLLVFAAGSFVKDLRRVEQHKGFTSEGTAIARIESGARFTQLQEIVSLHEKMLGSIKALPQLSSVAAVSPEPYGDSNFSELVTVEGQTPAFDGEDPAAATRRLISSAFFTTLEIPVRQGRSFTEGDRLGAPPVTIVSESFVRKFLQGKPALERRVRFCAGSEPEAKCPWHAIVGVVGDVEASPGDGVRPTVYFSYLQRPVRMMSFVARSRGADPKEDLASIRSAIHAAAPNQPISTLETYDDQISARMSRWRILSHVTAGFGLLALLIAAVGIYGATSHLAARRTHELGIRMAIGAKRTSIFALVLGSSAKIILVGIVLGMLAILAAAKLLDLTALEESSLDLSLILVTGVTVVGAAILAAFMPALRVSRIQPCKALREG